MLVKLRSQLTFANIVATMALFLALTGGAYALTIPRNSVGPKQLKRNAVTRAKIKDGAITSKKVKTGSLLPKNFKPGSLPAGATGPPGATGSDGAPGSARAYARVRALSCQPTDPGVSCTLSKAKGITSVVRGTVTGTYCVTAPGLSSASLPLFLTVDFDSVAGGILTALSDERSSSPFCGGDQFAVLTYADFEDNFPPALRGDISFTVLIP